MKPLIPIAALLACLAFAGCKSKEQKQQELAAQTQAVNEQLQKDCPKFDEKDNTGVQAALGQRPTPAQQAAAQQRQRDIQAKLNTPHCQELQSKLDDLYKQALALQNQ
jgi:hypothetical protein